MDDPYTEDNPQFSLLLSAIDERLSPDGVSKTAQKDYDEAVQSLRKARQNWLYKQIFYSEIGEVLSDLQVRAKEKKLTHDEEQFKDVLSKALAYAELPDYLHFSTNPSSKSTLFGLNPKDIENHNSVRQHLPTIRQVLIPMLEDRLNKKCDEIYCFQSGGHNKDVSSSSLLLAKAHALPGIIEDMKIKLQTVEKEKKKTRRQRDKIFRAFYQELLECLSIMSSIVQDHKIKQQAQTDQTAANWLEARLISFVLKLKRFELQVLCETYNAETAKALKAIGRHIDSATRQTESELASTTHSLQFFHSIGSEFNKVVDEFTKIRSEIENKKWGLENILGNMGSNIPEATVRSGGSTYRSDGTDGSSSLDTVREVKDRTI